MKSSYNRNLKPLARKLRKQGTKGEAILWKNVLKARQMKGYQFNRQFSIDNYIVDFICRKLNLIIEIDGSSHIGKSVEDFNRQKHLEDLGFTILRFSEAVVVYRIDEVVAEIDYVMECLEEALNSNPPSFPPFTKGDEELATQPVAMKDVLLFSKEVSEVGGRRIWIWLIVGETKSPFYYLLI